jgi:hypothetical protein
MLKERKQFLAAIVDLAGKYCNNHYAQSYLSIIMNLEENVAIRVQLQYALSNMRGWRGPEARLAKCCIKLLIEELKDEDEDYKSKGDK